LVSLEAGSRWYAVIFLIFEQKLILPFLQGSTVILITSVLAVVALLTTGVDAGLVGLVLSYALNITGYLVSLDIFM